MTSAFIRRKDLEDVLKDFFAIFQSNYNDYVSQIQGFKNDGIVMRPVEYFTFKIKEEQVAADPFMVFEIIQGNILSLGEANAIEFKFILYLYKADDNDNFNWERLQRYQKAIIALLEDNSRTIPYIGKLSLTSLPVFYIEDKKQFVVIAEITGRIG